MSFRRTLAAPPSTLASTDVVELALHARVRVPNGRFGNVIGFYRGPEEESVVVGYDRGDSGAFPACDLIVCS